MAANLSRLLEKHGLDFMEAVLEQLVGEPASLVLDDAQFGEEVVPRLWQAAPLQIRLLDPDYLGWSQFCLAWRDGVFETAGGMIKLAPNWRLYAARIAASFDESRTAGGDGPAGDVLAIGADELLADEHEGRSPAADTPLAKRRDSGYLPGQPGAAGRVPAIGIDLGTTYSVVAYLDPQGRPVSVPNASGDILTPSVVLFDQDGTVVGREAVLAAALEPDRVAECVKRDMGARHYRKKINGELLPPEVISSYILRKLRTDAERKLGPITKAVITVPAYFDETRRRATMDAGRLAGLEVLDIVNEPTAAAIVYGYQEGFLDRSGNMAGGEVRRVLVYDLGGGTFDVTVVEMSSQAFKAVATDGDVRLGGKDWDEKLVEFAAEQLIVELGDDPRHDPATLQEMWAAAEAAKKTLSERSKATMYINHQARRHKVEITREEFEEATAPLVSRTRTTAEIVVLQAGLTWKQIDRVVVVGGSTRMPMIYRMLEELAGQAVDHSVSADEAVAHGAALYADLLLQKQGVGGGHAHFTVSNINSHSLGIVGTEASSGKRVNRVLIPKNSPLPCTAARRFKTQRHNQPSVKISVIEGESEIPEACFEVGVCVIYGMPANLPAGWPVEVRYTYAENGRLQVTAQLVGHGAQVTTEFVRDNSLSDDDLMLWAECLSAEAQRVE
jgi:molecular chaperone DnaK